MPEQAEATDLPTPWDKAILELVNITRNEPQVIAQYFGLEDEDIFAIIPVMSPLWDNNKPELISNKKLQSVVQECVHTVIGEDNISSLDQDLVNKAKQAGYDVEFAFDYISIIAFNNYMSEDRALLNLYKQFYLDQIQNFVEGKLSIFSQSVKHSGMVLQPGKLTINGSTRNVYIMAAVFGYSKESILEDNIFARINEFRYNPLQHIEEINNKSSGFTDHIFIDQHSLKHGLQPYVKLSSVKLADTQKGDNNLMIKGDGLLDRYKWSMLVNKRLNEGELSQAVWSQFVLNAPDAFGGIVFSTQANSVNIQVEKSEMDNGQAVYEVDIRLYKSNVQNTNYFLGKLVDQQGEDENIAGKENYPEFDKVVLVMKNGQGQNQALSAVSSTGLFQVELPFGSQRYEVWDKGEYITSGTIFGNFHNQWKMVELNKD